MPQTAHLRPAFHSALAVLCAVLLLRSPAHAALSVDGNLARLPPGGASYAPTFPSKLVASNGFSYVGGVVNTTLYAAFNSTAGQGYSNASVILDWNEQLQKTVFAGSPVFPSNTSRLFSGAFAEQPLSVVAASRLAALLNVAMYETVLLFTASAGNSVVDPFNPDGSCPPRVTAVSGSAVCPRYVTLKDLGNGVPALAASYAAHYLLTYLLPTKAGSGGSSLTNLRYDALLKNHQQWFNLQWSKAENNPGWKIGYSASAKANTSTACPGQVGFCAAAIAAASNNTVTKASQAVGITVATAILAARVNDGAAAWSPLSLSLNAPSDDAAQSPPAAGTYTTTANNNPAAAASVPVNSGGDDASVAGPARSTRYADAYLNFGPYGSGTTPGVKPYNLSPQLASAAGFVVNPQAPAYQNAITPLRAVAGGAAWAASQALTAAGSAASSAAGFTDAQRTAFNWRLGPGSHGLSGHFSSIAAYVLNNATATYSLLQTAQLYAQLHTAIFDAQAAAWAAKQHFLTARPESDLSATPGQWQPLIANPPYPAFPSAHAATCSAAVVVLQAFFGADAIPLSGGAAALQVTSTDSWQLGSYTTSASGATTWNIMPTASNTITRSYATFSSIAAECAASRVAGGVQYDFSTTAGSALGAAVATDVLAAYPGALGAAMPAVWSYLSYLPAPSTSGDAGMRRGAVATALLLAAALAALLA